MGANIVHSVAAGSGTGGGGLIGAADWNAGHVVTGLYNRRPIWFVFPGSSALQAAGGQFSGVTPTVTGTNGSGATGVAAEYVFTSAATTNALANVANNIQAYIPPLNNKGSQGVGISATIDFPDVSYGSGATGARLGFGICRAVANMFGADDGTAASNTSQGIWFSYSTNRGGNWRIVVNSQVGAVNLIDTGVAFASGVWVFGIDFDETTATFFWSIRQIGGSSASGTATNAVTPFPVNTTTNYQICAGLATLTTTARKVGIIRMGIDYLDPA